MTQVLSLSLCNARIQEGKEKAAIWKAGSRLYQTAHLSAPWSWTSQPSDLWEIHVCCLKPPSLLQQPELRQVIYAKHLIQHPVLGKPSKVRGCYFPCYYNTGATVPLMLLCSDSFTYPSLSLDCWLPEGRHPMEPPLDLLHSGLPRASPA